jgi:hypothetical protein
MNRVSRLQSARNHVARRIAHLVLAPAAILFAASSFASAAQDAPLRYVHAKDGGAKLYNLADKTSLEVGSVQGKTLLEVYAERAGYLSVDAPAGFEVWVFGEYVRPTQLAGTIEVTGDTVLMRPLPKSDPSAYPLEQRLHKGDRVKVVGRADPKKPLDKDWVRIVTPPGTRAWVLASDVRHREEQRGRSRRRRPEGSGRSCGGDRRCDRRSGRASGGLLCRRGELVRRSEGEAGSRLGGGARGVPKLSRQAPRRHDGGASTHAPPAGRRVRRDRCDPQRPHAARVAARRQAR